MEILKNILVLFVAALHVYILYIEMFLWNKPKGLKIFRMTQAQADSSKVLAANQGLYNGFLAGGLFWSVLEAESSLSFQLSLFFLGCVIVAALYGGYTVGKKILMVQGIPKDFLDPSCAAPIETILRKFHSAWLFKNQSLYDQGAINSAYITKRNFLSSSERLELLKFIASKKLKKIL